MRSGAERFDWATHDREGIGGQGLEQYARLSIGLLCYGMAVEAARGEPGCGEAREAVVSTPP